jgi:hypothetical protein
VRERRLEALGQTLAELRGRRVLRGAWSLMRRRRAAAGALRRAVRVVQSREVRLRWATWRAAEAQTREGLAAERRVQTFRGAWLLARVVSWSLQYS